MKLKDSILYEDDQSIIDTTLLDCGVRKTWPQLTEKGWTYLTDDPLIMWADGMFDTPSRKIEIASECAEVDGFPRIPQPSTDTPPAQGKLRLISPADTWQMNSSFGNDVVVKKQMGPATVTCHPETASKVGVTNGSLVRLSNELGEIQLEAYVSDMVPVGTLLVYKSRCLKMEESGKNINVLSVRRKTDMGGSTCVHSTEVTMSRIDQDYLL